MIAQLFRLALGSARISPITKNLQDFLNLMTSLSLRLDLGQLTLIALDYGQGGALKARAHQSVRAESS